MLPLTAALRSSKRTRTRAAAPISLTTRLLVFTFVFLCADLGIISEADGALAALAVALVLPSMAPYLLLIIASLQDAPGLSYKWWYGGFILIGMVCLIHGIASLSGRRAQQNTILPTEIQLLSLSCMLLVIYGWVISILLDNLDIAVQSPHRNPSLVALLMAFMVTTAYSSLGQILRDTEGAGTLRLTLAACLLHSLLIALLQIPFGPTFLSSGYGRIAILQAQQLVEPTSMGIPRLTSTFLTPNGFALNFGLMMMGLLSNFNEQKVGKPFAMLYLLGGILVSTMTFSKAMAAFFLASGFLLMLNAFGPTIILTTLAGLLPALLYLATTGVLGKLAVAFRLPTSLDQLGYRGEAWNLILQKFDLFNWLIGTGTSHWPVFFERQLTFSLADPHSFILSIPGSYGLVGILFYLILLVLILKRAVHRTGATRMLACSLLLLFFVKDLYSVPYIIGNTPMSFVIWLILGLFFTSPRTSCTKAATT
ncbi:O-antigen ligase family protein [Thermodesulfobacteriota bacterium B35]